MPQSLHAHAPAKVNLFLEITSKRPDGFHNIDSVFAQTSLADHLHISTQNTPHITLKTTGPHIPPIPPTQNLVHQALTILQTHTTTPKGLTIHLIKNIPPSSGLGGGSSDAATALSLANNLWNTNLNTNTLQNIGAQLGSDIPFFFHGGICLCTGRGEIVTPLKHSQNLKNITLVLALTNIHCNTAKAFQSLTLPKKHEITPSTKFAAALQTPNLTPQTLEKLAFNRFETSIFKSYPQLGRLHKELEKLVDRPVRLSGSGGTLWFLTQHDETKPLLQTPSLNDWTKKNNVTLEPCQIHGNSNQTT